MKRILFIILVSLAVSPSLLFAEDDPYIQYLPEYMPQSPNAQAVARAIDIPVNYYTGLPNISIPLYTVQVGSISVPITLSYQGGGIRPSQEATSVGLGWNLNAGGAITRTVKCADDFMEYRIPDGQFEVGFWGRSAWPSNNENIDENYYRRRPGTPDIGATYMDYYLYVDSEPDIYFYSVPNHSGKFTFKKDTTVVYLDKSDNVKVYPEICNLNAPFSARDSHGIFYDFETKERTHIYTCATGGDVNTTAYGKDITPGLNSILTGVSDYTSTWYLSKMLSPTNDTIVFDYEDEYYWLPLQESCRYNEKISGPSVGEQGLVYSGTKTEVEGKRLNRISWRGGYVEFIYAEH